MAKAYHYNNSLSQEQQKKDTIYYGLIEQRFQYGIPMLTIRKTAKIIDDRNDWEGMYYKTGG